MTDFTDIAKKAFYLGVGLVTYASEKASTKLSELQNQAQTLAEEMIERGETTTEETRQHLDSLLQQVKPPTQPSTHHLDQKPRRIEILATDEDSNG